jgi:predicted GIY-YIG superfamily endonuclease
MTTNVYALKLENDKWYIGKSDNPENRFLAHKSGTGSAWTRLHKPIEVHAIFRDVSPFHEDALTKEYMSIYGIEHVRGGSYVRIELTKGQKDYIMKELWSMKNLCNKCGSSDHWVANCHAVEVAEEPVETPVASEAISIATNTHWFTKVNNEFTNKDSDLRSGRWFRRLFGRV